MIDILIVVFLAALSNWAVIETWRHGEIFERLRAWLQAHDPSFLQMLLTCPYCLSHWTAFPILVSLMVCAVDPIQPWYRYLALIPLSLASTRLSNALNDTLHSWCRTPRPPALEGELSELQMIIDMEKSDERATETPVTPPI